MSKEPTVARRVVAHGHVQGVFFRDSCRREAEELGVNGWVANAYDGTVAAVFEGPPDAVAALVEWAKSGPRQARVDRLDVEDVEPSGAVEFRVR